MVTITTDADFDYVLPRVPDLYMIGADVIFLFSDEWFDLMPSIRKKGLIRVGEYDEISIFAKNGNYPDIFDFDNDPKILEYLKSDNRICLYHDNSSNCPKDYFPFKYENKQSIGLSTIILLQKYSQS